MTTVLPRSLDDHVMISRMAKALRKLLWLDRPYSRFRIYRFEEIDICDSLRLDSYAVTAELRRREVFQTKRRDAA